jgi:threonine dehydrogenase-like Zn-dependent dehydrogenase
MMNVETYREHAAECLRQAEAEAAPEDKNILLNVALAWVRLAHQVQEVGQEVGVVGAGAAGAAAVVAAADAAEAVDVQDTPDETVETVETDEAEAETAEADRKPTTRLDQFQHDVEKVLFAH